MIYKPPTAIDHRDKAKKSVFLAGSIEMDTAINWQQHYGEVLKKDFNVLNPRRESWDSTWEQTIENPYFKEQVEWELNGLAVADYILLFLAAGTKSPISLLEFGLYASSDKLLVVCEEGFWRKGNVDIVCQYYQINQYKTLEEALNQLLQMN